VEQIAPRDARAEAELQANALRGSAVVVQIIEPAPPAVNEPPWFADGEPSGERIVSPYGPSEWRWATLADENQTLREWCEERWLGPYAPLEPLPPYFESTRESLHRLAARVISPARERANTKIGLRWTLGGFGTPFFGADAQVRVEHGLLVVQGADSAHRAEITTFNQARELLGELAAPDANDADSKRLAIDARAASSLGDVFGFATSVLEELRQDADPQLEASRVQLWPEHFDVSIELGSEAAGQRAGYGVSPGDEAHSQPYIYVVPWGAVPTGERWQAHEFAGAELGYAELLAAPDQRAAALEFLRGCLQDLLN
jgi:hypothetical protein